MGERDPRKTMDLLLLQLAVADGSMTTEEATEAFMDKWYGRDDEGIWNMVATV